MRQPNNEGPSRCDNETTGLTQASEHILTAPRFIWMPRWFRTHRGEQSGFVMNSSRG